MTDPAKDVLIRIFAAQSAYYRGGSRQDYVAAIERALNQAILDDVLTASDLWPIMSTPADTKVIDIREAKTTTSCRWCKGTGIATVMQTERNHSRFGMHRPKTAEVPCPAGCNREAVEQTIAESRDLMNRETEEMISKTRYGKVGE